MPKERISRPVAMPMPEPGPDGVTTLTADHGTYVSMHWTNGRSGDADGLVQVALTTHIDVLRAMVEEWDNGIHYSDTDTSDQVMLFSGELDRDSLQRLIRSARVARNSAFGRDE